MGAIKYGQAQLDISDEMEVNADRSRYTADRAKDIRLSATEGIDAALKEHNLDALLFPGPSGAGIAAKPGYPTVMVPFAMIASRPGAGPGGPGAAGGAPNPANQFPEGFEPKPAPYGVSFTGTKCSEPRLLELAFAFEQASKRRVPPPLFP
jgi:amidase